MNWLKVEEASMPRSSLNPNVGLVFRTSYRLVRTALGLVHSSALLLVPGDRSKSAADELSSSVRGGILNYRTGKLDDGTDPYGWYERD